MHQRTQVSPVSPREFLMESQPDSSVVKRILIDQSHTFDSRLNSGIQRVVRKILEHMPPTARQRGIQCHAVVFRDGRFQFCEQQAKWLEPPTTKELEERDFPAWYRASMGMLLAKAPKRLRTWFLPKQNNQGVLYIPWRLKRSIKRVVRTLTRSRRSVLFQPGDLLLLPDGYWVMKRIWPEVQRARDQGATIQAVVYDLICIQHPEFFVPDASEKFDLYLHRIFHFSDRIHAISQTVQQDLVQFQATLERPTEPPPRLMSFKLGCDLTQRVPNPPDQASPAPSPVDTPREDLQEVFCMGDSAPWMVVSTLEPRKNHATVLAAFNLLWPQSDQPLVFVGRRGWMCETLVQELCDHAQWQSKLFWFDDLTDDDLTFSYQHAAGVICPSWAEGFGLPVVESLRYGKRTLVSDIPIHREVGGEACEYFSPDQPTQLSELITQQSMEQPNQAVDSSLPTWSTSVSELLDNMLHLDNPG